VIQGFWADYEVFMWIPAYYMLGQGFLGYFVFFSGVGLCILVKAYSVLKIKALSGRKKWCLRHVGFEKRSLRHVRLEATVGKLDIADFDMSEE
jgi:hypothetical protein